MTKRIVIRCEGGRHRWLERARPEDTPFYPAKEKRCIFCYRWMSEVYG